MTEKEYLIYKRNVEEVINKSRLNEIFHFNEGMKENLVDIFVHTIYIKDKTTYNKSPWQYIISFCIGILYSMVKIRLRLRPSRRIKNTKYIFLSSLALYNRFVNVVSVIPSSQVMYLPEFRGWDLLDKHVKTHKDNGNRVTLLSYSLKDFFYLIGCLVKNSIFLIRLTKVIRKVEWDTTDKIHTRFIVFILKYWTFYSLLRRHIQKINDGKVWVLDHDKTASSFVLKKIIEEFDRKDKLVVINHGSFEGFNLWYIKPMSDYVICTSEREKKIILQYSENISVSNIFPVGVALQSFSDKSKNVNYTTDKLHQLLILGTTTELEPLYKLQHNFLSFLQDKGIDYRYRCRPASAKNDRIKLADYLTEDKITFGTSLYEDCISSNVIISFSLDALGTCLRNRIPTILLLSSEQFKQFSTIGHSNNAFCITDNFNHVFDFVQNSNHNYTSQTMQYIKDNIGILEYDEVMTGFKDILLKIKNQ